MTRRGWPARGWYIVNDSVPDDRTYYQRILAVYTSGKMWDANVNLVVAREGVNYWVARTGKPWLWTD